MTSFQRLQELFDQAVVLEGDERQAFIEEACQGDDKLREQLESLLAADSDRTVTWKPDPSAPLNTGETQLEGSELGAYRLLRRIGRGGMGTVYLAERADGAFERQVAVKVVRRGMDTEQVVARFEAERQILSRLDHPNISQLLDGGVTPDGRPYLVMEYVDGVRITTYCDEQRLNIQQRLSLFQSVCRAVQHAHQNLIVHRDLKPSNILVTADGVVKLLDFGIAKLLDEAEDPQLTRTGRQLLTPAYASPEQMEAKPVTTGTDVYALGVILYELLTSRRPYETKRNTAEMRELVMSGNAPKPSAVITRLPGAAAEETSTQSLDEVSASRSLPPARLRQTLSGDLDTICLMAIRPDPVERYSSAEQLAEDVQRHLSGQPVQAQKPSATYRLKKFVRRHRVGVAATTAVLLAFAAMITFYTVQLAQERDAALAEQRKFQQVVEFVTNLFFEADPDMSRGEDVTARQILDAGRRQIDNELTDQPGLQAAMKNVLGNVYYNLGNTEAAEEMLQSAYDSMDGDHAPTLETADSRLSLGLLQQDRGDYDAAAASLQYALDVRLAELAPDHEAVREVIAAQAYLQETLANFEEAERLHLEAFRMAQELYSEDEVPLAQAHGELAGFYRTQDRREEAEELLRAGLAMMETHHPGLHPLTAKMKRNLAGVMRNSNRLDEAEALYLEVIAEQEKLLGTDHHEVAVTWNGYSQVLSKQGRNREAIEANQIMIGIVERISDGPAPSLGAAYNNLAFMLMDEDRMEEALENFDLSLEMQDAVGIPPRHLNRTFPTSGKASVYYQMGQVDEAEALWRDMLDIRLEVLGTDHRLTAEIQSSLGRLLTEQQQFDEAERLLTTAYGTLSASQNIGDVRRRESAQRLADLYTATGRAELAAPLLEEVAQSETGDKG